MSYSQKTYRCDYLSRNARTGLTDVKGQVYFNGVAKAVGSSALTFTELDPTNAPGLYSLLITAANLTSWGVAAGQENALEIYVNSATAPYPSPKLVELTIANDDDLAALIGTPASTSVSSDIAAVAAQTASILSQVQALANAARTGGVGIVALNALIPTTGTTAVEVPITVTNSDGTPENATSIVVGLTNVGGTDMGSYITGSSGSPAVYSPSASSTGLYYVNLAIPTTAVEGELVLKATITVGGITYTQFAVINLQTDLSAAGYATASALAAVAANVSTVLADLTNGTYGLPALQSLLSTASSNAATAASQATSANSGIATANAALTAIEGSGFSTGSNSLVALSAAIASIPLYGGVAR